VITQHLERKFNQMGARVKVRTQVDSRWRIWPVTRFALDVREDRRGAYFDLAIPPEDTPDLQIVDVRSDLRHLLLLVRQEGRKDKFLCGHDERYWFTCAVPGASVSNVKTALAALKPAEVRQAEDVEGLRLRERFRRHNRAYRRQGEWFFLPQPEMVVGEQLIHRDEPIRRGSGKPHWCEELYRTGGETVHVSGRYPNGLADKEYQKLIAQNPAATKWAWRIMTRNAGVYVRGHISHPDHATIQLFGWHRVIMNTEHDAPAARNVVFLD
jgi:hypothetical protein